MGYERIPSVVNGMGNTRNKSLRTKGLKDSLPDDALLIRIAQRDLEAFEEFYNRHSKAMFKVACYITHDRQLAEDAVQDAVLAIFDSARSYSPGNARGWVLSIVAHKSSLLQARVSQRQRKIEELKNRSEVRKIPGPGDSAETDDSKSVLRVLLNDLPMRDRQIVSLYYVSGFSQYQIARQLSIPQRTVAYRMAKVTADLKEGCTRAGLAAVPLSGSAMIAALSEPGDDVPLEALDVRVLDAARSICNEKVAASTRVAGGALLWVLLVGGVVALVSTVAGITFPMWSASSQRIRAKDQDLLAGDPEKMQWSFNDGVPDGFKPLFGTFNWNREGQGKGGLEAPGIGLGGGLRLPITHLETPFSVSVSGRATGKDPALTLGWLDGERMCAYTDHHFEDVEKNKASGNEILFSMRFVVFGKRVLRYINGRPHSMSACQSVGDALYLFMGRVKLFSVSFRALDAVEAAADRQVLSEQLLAVRNVTPRPAYAWRLIPAPPFIRGEEGGADADQLATSWQPEHWMPRERNVLKKKLVLPREPSASISWDPKEARITNSSREDKPRRVLVAINKEFTMAVRVPEEFREFSMCEVLLRNERSGVIEIKGKQATQVYMNWSVDGKMLPHRIWIMDRDLVALPNSFFRARFYLLGRLLVLSINGHMVALNEHRRPLDLKAGRLLVVVGNAEVLGLTWYGLDAKRLPAKLKDLRELSLTSGFPPIMQGAERFKFPFSVPDLKAK